MFRRILIITLILVAGVAIINDVGRYVITVYDLTDTTQSAALAAARAGDNRDAAALAAVGAAAAGGITVYAFDMDGSKVYVWTEVPLEGTWILGPMLGTIAGENLASDYLLRAEHSALRQ